MQSMSKVLAVFGATGQQGSSVVNYVLNDPELSKGFGIRAITRDTSSDKLASLKSRVEVVYGDASDPSSLPNALVGANFVFAMTTPFEGYEAELSSAKAIADAAVEQGAEYIIFSTLPPVSKLSGGKYTKVTPFDAKAKVEEYIRNLPIKSAFFSPGGFMQNFNTFMKPQPAGDGTYVIAQHVSPTSRIPLIDAVGDTGKFIGAILADPEKYNGETFCAATALYSLDEQAQIMSKATGKMVVYKQISAAEFRATLPFMADVLVEGLSFQDEFGYYGPDTERLVSWAVENARGKLTTLEEYFQAHPLEL